MSEERSRRAGVCLHPTSLPSRFGIGDFGPEAHRFLEWLAKSGATIWQVLPLHPTGHSSSPYSASSSFAGSPALISPELLVQDGLLEPSDLQDAADGNADRVDYAAAVPFKQQLLRRAWRRFADRGGELVDELERFREREAAWLGPECTFAALKFQHKEAGWQSWAPRLAARDPDELSRWSEVHRAEIDYQEFVQFLFDRQWMALRARAKELGISILGDVPIYVAGDSADVWMRRDQFRLDERGEPLAVAGVPPDYFSKQGQRWGNPLYDWARMKESGYAWWISRLQRALALADMVRLDHFRGFAAYWEIPAAEKTAVGGSWIDGPGLELFEAVRAALGGLPFIAEDLGHITEPVIKLRRDLGIPGMAVLQFAFDPNDTSDFLPHRHERSLAVYTGTHDSNTAVGWWREDATRESQEYLRRYVGTLDESQIHWTMIRMALSSVADLALIPVQDLFGLGSEARMNLPGAKKGQWGYRLRAEQLDDGVSQRLAEMSRIYGRGR